MTIVQITKKKLIDAILTEPLNNLNHGAWVQYDGNGLSHYNNIKTNCPVCAVGAVMRHILDDDQTLMSISNAACQATRNFNYLGWGEKKSSYKKILSEIDDGDIKLAPMAALSQGFEACCNAAAKRSPNFSSYEKTPISNDQKYRIRKALVEWVKNKFPAKMNIDIDGARPAKDIKVILED